MKPSLASRLADHALREDIGLSMEMIDGGLGFDLALIWRRGAEAGPIVVASEDPSISGRLLLTLYPSREAWDSVTLAPDEMRSLEESAGVAGALATARELLGVAR